MSTDTKEEKLERAIIKSIWEKSAYTVSLVPKDIEGAMQLIHQYGLDCRLDEVKRHDDGFSEAANQLGDFTVWDALHPVFVRRIEALTALKEKGENDEQA